MDIDEIKRYCSTGYGICVYRKRVKKAQFVIQCVNIRCFNSEAYEVHVDFDPMGMVDMGEGIRWASEDNRVEEIINSLEVFIGKPIEKWENFTRTSFEPAYNSEIITSEHFQKSWDVLKHRYENGKLLLPNGLKFKLLSKWAKVT